uniref:Proline-, glutamic acid- and leucine-rich protein 1 n=1 Tax=Phallusia mammillata TaxID=59560 RepID=A0A6F9DPF1_9ASCI|nr:proline-, glutamic acid- and leucine-rich protein 1 [Phallusia mammillata]
MQEVDKELFSLLHKKSWSKNLDISNINEWIRLSAERWKGFYTMELVLSRCTEDVILKNGISWIEIAATTVVKNHIEESVRTIAASNFAKLLEISTQIPSVSKELSSNHVINILQLLLSSDNCNPVPCLACMEAIMKHFPAPCNPHKGKVSKYIFPHTLSLKTNAQDAAIRCWSMVALLGGGGQGRKNHALQWEQQFDETLKAWKFISTNLWDPKLDEGEVDPSIGSLSFHFDPLPSSEPDLSITLVQRFLMVCKCLCGLLNLNFPHLLNVSVDKIFNLLIANFDVTPKSLKHIIESHLSVDCLQTVHIHCLYVLRACIESGHTALCRRATQVNRMFLNLLTMWRDTNPTFGMSKNCIKIRLNIYGVMLYWVESCGSKSRFLMGQKHFTQPLLEYMVENFSLIPDYERGNTDIQAKKPIVSGRKKSKRLINSDVSFSRIVDSSANSQVCIASLKVLRICIYSNGSMLPSFVHKSLQKHVILLLMDIMRAKNIIPYTHCAGCRKELYHLLLALTVVPSPEYPAPLQLALTIIRHGSARDSDMDVRSFCMEASATLSNIVRPRIPALNRICPSMDVIRSVQTSAQYTSETHLVHVEESEQPISQTSNEVEMNTETDVRSSETSTSPLLPVNYEEQESVAKTISETESNDDPVPEANQPVMKLPVTSDASFLSPFRNTHEVAIESDCDHDVNKLGENSSNHENQLNEIYLDNNSTRGQKRKLENTQSPTADMNTEENEQKVELTDDITAMLSDFVDASPDDDTSGGDQ